MTLTRRHDTQDGWREAVYSTCERYRYRLTAEWDAGAPKLLYVMLNPSKATELANDPTIERCQRRARMLGYGAIGIVNLFGLRETSPKRLMAARAPVGPDNLEQVEAALNWADDTLAAWGVHGAHRRQAEAIIPVLKAAAKPLFHLGLSKEGHPRHPLYIPYSTKPVVWDNNT